MNTNLILICKPACAMIISIMFFSNFSFAQSNESGIVGANDEHALCAAARLAIKWSRGVGDKVGIPSIVEKKYVVVNEFNANGENKFSKPRKIKRADWRQLKSVDTAPKPSDCNNLDNFREAIEFADTLEEARANQDAAVVTFEATLIKEDNKQAAMHFGVIDFSRNQGLTGILVPSFENNEWKLNPIELRSSYIN